MYGSRPIALNLMTFASPLPYIIFYILTSFYIFAEYYMFLFFMYAHCNCTLPVYTLTVLQYFCTVGFKYHDQTAS